MALQDAKPVINETGCDDQVDPAEVARKPMGGHVKKYRCFCCGS